MSRTKALRAVEYLSDDAHCCGRASLVLDHALALETLRGYIEANRLAHDRYEYLRRLNPRQFQELYQRNINGEGAFDDLVDRLIEEHK